VQKPAGSDSNVLHISSDRDVNLPGVPDQFIGIHIFLAFVALFF
jgi:hypothetical protein